MSSSPDQRLKVLRDISQNIPMLARYEEPGVCVSVMKRCRVGWREYRSMGQKIFVPHLIFAF